MNLFLQYLPKALDLLPVIIAGIETLHKNMSGADKKQKALSVLGAAMAVGTMVSPDHAAAVQAVGSAASKVIDGIVDGYNASGAFAKAAAVSAGGN